MLVALAPAALAALLIWQAGGYFARTHGVVTVLLAIAFALRTTLARRPFASFNGPVAVVAGALAGLAAWMLLSATWSDAPGRAVDEFTRTLLYGFAFLLAASLPYDRRRVELAVRALAAVIFVACLVGWSTRVAPDVFAGPERTYDRLAYPLSYWNAQGLLSALGVLLGVHLACTARGALWVKALGAASVPLLASTLFFTFSRGAMLGLFVGLAAYLCIYRSRSLIGGMLTIVPTTGAALAFSYEASELAGFDYKSPLGIAQGRDVAIGLLFCVLFAALLRVAAARWVEPPVDRVEVPARARRPLIAVLVAAAVAIPVALGLPATVERQFDRFVEGNRTPETDQRSRIFNPGNNGRLDHWRVALDAWRDHPVTGTGAGTFQLQWNQRRKDDLVVRDGHSLYVETLSDLGLVGFGLVVLALLGMIGAGVRRAARRRRTAWADRSLDAVVVALVVAWAVHAGLDWMWEMPALTAWLFALAGMALAARVPSRGEAGPGRATRVAVGLSCLVLAVVPWQAAQADSAFTDAVRAFDNPRRDCRAAIDASLRAVESLNVRPEPWEIVAYCDIGEGQPTLAVQAARNAIERDPDNWVYHYASGLVQSVAGEDPRPAMRRAVELNPRGELGRTAVRRLERVRPRPDRWAAVGRTLKLPFD